MGGIKVRGEIIRLSARSSIVSGHRAVAYTGQPVRDSRSAAQATALHGAASRSHPGTAGKR
jgi:hypothetical protein